MTATRDQGGADNPFGSVGSAPPPMGETATKTMCIEFRGKRTWWQLVDPELASRWLAENNDPAVNRPQNEAAASRHASDMRTGLWEETHQGVAFDAEWILLDGQTRLRGIALSGKPQWLMATWGIPRKAMQVVDRNRVRTLAHTLHMMGKTGMSGIPAAARAMFGGPTLTGGGKGSGYATDSAMLDFIERHEEALRTVVGNAKFRAATQAPIQGALARATYHLPKALIDRFIQAYLDQIPTHLLRPGDSTARKLAKVSAETRHAGGHDRGAMYRKAQRAIQAFAEGKDLERLYEESGDLFPLPAAEPAAAS